MVVRWWLGGGEEVVRSEEVVRDNLTSPKKKYVHQFQLSIRTITTVVKDNTVSYTNV